MLPDQSRKIQTTNATFCCDRHLRWHVRDELSSIPHGKRHHGKYAKLQILAIRDEGCSQNSYVHLHEKRLQWGREQSCVHRG